MHKLEDLQIWQKAMSLTEKVYETLISFPDEEKFGLNSQIKRSAISIPSNIAEGAGRNSTKEFKHFLSIANGSSYELQTQLILAAKFKYIEEKQLKILLNQITEIQKMSYGFQKKLD